MNEFQQLLEQATEASATTNTKKYWLVRTDDGANYNTFSERSFVALNLQNFPIGFVNAARQIENPRERLSALKNSLMQLHQQQPNLLSYDSTDSSYSSNMGRLASQISSISLEMNRGDIVLIPSQGASVLKIGRIVDVDLATDVAITRHFSFARKVEWIKEISKRRLEANLYKALGAQQAICDISKYASVIERNYTSYFVIDDEYHYVLTVNAETVSAYELTALVQNVLKTVDEISHDFNLGIDAKDIKISINVNSPGKMDFISTGKKVILTMAVAVALAGGTLTYEHLEVKTEGLFGSLVDAVNRWKNAEQTRRQNQELFDLYKNSLGVKTVEDWNAMLDEVEEHSEDH